MWPWTSTTTLTGVLHRPRVVVHTGQPLLQRQDCGHVEVAEPLLLGRREHRVRALCHRHGHAELLALLEHQHHVLAHQRELEGRVLEPPSLHHRAAEIHHRRAVAAAVDHLQDCLAGQPGALAEHHRLGESGHLHAGEHVLDHALVGQTEHHDVGVRGRVGGGVRDARAELSHLLGLGAGAVVDGHLEARLRQATGHAQAHVAEPYVGDALFVAHGPGLLALVVVPASENAAHRGLHEEVAGTLRRRHVTRLEQMLVELLLEVGHLLLLAHVHSDVHELALELDDPHHGVLLHEHVGAEQQALLLAVLVADHMLGSAGVLEDGLHGVLATRLDVPHQRPNLCHGFSLLGLVVEGREPKRRGGRDRNTFTAASRSPTRTPRRAGRWATRSTTCTVAWPRR